MILYQIPILIFTLALVSIFIAPEEPFAFHLFFQLLPMIVVVGYAFRLVPKDKKSVHWLVLTGLIFSLIGDALSHWFVVGLLFYFLAHVSYTIGFFSVSSWKRSDLLYAVLIGIYVILFSTLVTSGVREHGDNALILPLIAYITMFSITLLAAILTKNKTAITGSFLFLVSHSILFWHAWVTPIPYVEGIVPLLYYAAQFFIAISLYSLIERNRRIVW
jgi:uncharacterized membrane protein YhhN